MIAMAMSVKRGRNDPCWCGSGKKYKKCHLDRGEEKPVQPWEVDAHIRGRDKSGLCLYPGAAAGSICGQPAIGSHTVPRKMLKQIARNGHVYRHSATIQDLQRTGGRLAVKLIGVNDASVLRVFCDTHDSVAFAPLEQAAFTGSQEQCFLLAYRALCHEFFKKRSVLESIPVMKGFDRGKTQAQQVNIQTVLNAQALGSDLSMRDMEEHKRRFDSMVADADYSETRAYVVIFDAVPEILCAGAIYPECDFAGHRLQDLSDLSAKMELITFSLIATDSGGAFVLAWHADGDAVCRLLAASLDKLTDDQLPHAVARFVFEFCENHYLKPDWWDNADDSIKSVLTTRLQTSASVWEPRSAACLLDDGLRAIAWKVISRTWL
jgi:hypothetical protein